MGWINLAKYREKWQAVVNTVQLLDFIRYGIFID